MNAEPLRVTVYVDGGARGNPGPAGAGVVIDDNADGQNLYEGGVFLGHATNNVAEYHGLLKGLEQAAALAADEVRVVSDSELLVRQLSIVPVWAGFSPHKFLSLPAYVMHLPAVVRKTKPFLLLSRKINYMISKLSSMKCAAILTIREPVSISQSQLTM